MKITVEQQKTLLKKIARYRERKNDDMFDAFYHADLDIMEELVKNAEIKTIEPEVEEEVVSETPEILPYHQRLF